MQKSFPSQSFNIGTFGKTSPIESLDTNIYEFEWGSGTTPEILGWGVFKTGKILKVNNINSVTTVNQSDGFETRIGRGNFFALNTTALSSYRLVNGVPAGVPPNTSTGSYTVPSASINNTRYYVNTPEVVSDYYYILNNSNPVNTEITPIIYNVATDGSNPIIPKSTKIVTTEFGVPSISTYAFTSSRSPAYNQGNFGDGYTNSISGYGLIKLNRTLGRNVPNTLERNVNGYYTDNGTSPILQVQSTINASLNMGERWFVTIFNSFEYPTGSQNWDQAILPTLGTGSLTPYNVGYDIQDEFGNYPNPLAYKGVHEILGCQVFSDSLDILLANPRLNADGSYYDPTLFPYSPVTPEPGIQIGGNVAGNSLGLLIWKGEQSFEKNQFIIVQDNVTGGVTEGAFTNRFTPKEITDNLTQITKEFGSNKQ